MEFFVKNEAGAKDCLFSKQVEFKEKPLEWQLRGFQYTATGYGSKIPTRYMVRWFNRWHRVYCMVYSNSGTLYILDNGKRLIVDTYGD